MASVIKCWLFGHMDVRDYTRKPRMCWGFTREVPYICSRCDRKRWKVEAA